MADAGGESISALNAPPVNVQARTWSMRPEKFEKKFWGPSRAEPIKKLPVA